MALRLMVCLLFPAILFVCAALGFWPPKIWEMLFVTGIGAAGAWFIFALMASGPSIPNASSEGLWHDKIILIFRIICIISFVAAVLFFIADKGRYW